MHAFDVSVVIPTYRRAAILHRTLMLYGEQRAAGRFEIIVVDDASGDGTPVMLGDIAGSLPYPLRFFVQDANCGPSAARNRALREAQGRILLIAGDDILPEPNLIAEHSAWHDSRHPEAAVAVLGRILWAEPPEVTPLMRWLETSGSQFGYGRIRHGEAVDYGYFYTSNVSLKRDFLRETGQFLDERLRFCEDSEWGQRLFARGLSLRYNAEALGRHLHPITLPESLRRMEQVGRAVRALRSINPENFARLTGGLLEPGRAGKLALLRLLLHPAVDAAVYAPLARLCERRVVADKIYAASHASHLMRGLLAEPAPESP